VIRSFYLLAQSSHPHLNLRDWLHIAIATNNSQLLARFGRGGE
jgi:hypothetical protein